MNIKPIKIKKDYEQALERLELIFDVKKSTPKGDELELFSMLVDNYENENFPKLVEVDILVDSRPLNKQEQVIISDFIKLDKMKNAQYAPLFLSDIKEVEKDFEAIENNEI